MTMREQPRDPASHDEVAAWLARARPEQLRRLIDDIRASGTDDIRGSGTDDDICPSLGDDIRPTPGRIS